MIGTQVGRVAAAPREEKNLIPARSVSVPIHPDAAVRLGHSGVVPVSTIPEVYDVATMRSEMASSMPFTCGDGRRDVRVTDLPSSVLTVPARLYRPLDGVDMPVVLALHGGGWVSGSPDTHDVVWRRLAGHRLVVIALDYRLAPEHPFPAAFEDVESALRRLTRLTDVVTDLDVDTGRVGLIGDSAGGNLAAAASLQFRNDDMVVIGAQVLVYPVLDARMNTPSYDEFGQGFGLTRQKMAYYWDSYCSEPELRGDSRAAPGAAQPSANLPPTLIITAECDVLRDEGEDYAQRLAEAGVDAVAVRYRGVSHGFFRMHRSFRSGPIAADQAATFLLDRLGPG